MALSPDEEPLYVACADSSAVSVLDTQTGRELERIGTSLYPQVPNGSTPDSLALAANGNTLWIANADANNVAVFDVSHRGQSRSLGFLPVGWYPTSVRISAAGDRILVANGKGLTSKANRNGPNPLVRKIIRREGYIAGLLSGALSVIRTPEPDQMAAAQPHRLRVLSGQVRRQPHRPADRAGQSDPQRSSADQAPSSTASTSSRKTAPTTRFSAICRRATANRGCACFPSESRRTSTHWPGSLCCWTISTSTARSSANGHEWSMAAYATDYVEKVWPINYRRGRARRRVAAGIQVPVGRHGGDRLPSSGYLWDRCREASVSYRSYGEFIANGEKPSDPGHARVKTLEGHFDPLLPRLRPGLQRPAAGRPLHRRAEAVRSGGADAATHDRSAAQRSHVGDEARHADADGLPGRQRPGAGRIVEAVSHSKFWPTTAIFVLEDDAQNGSDHVDAHRSLGMVVSPYTKRHAVDSSMYSTSSMLRTHGTDLGPEADDPVRCGRAAVVRLVSGQVRLDPLHAPGAPVDLGERNPAEAWGAPNPAAMDFREADAADEQRLNEIIWRSVRGARSPMPPPVHAAFFMPHCEREERE